MLFDTKILTVEVRSRATSLMCPIDDGDGAPDRASLEFVAGEPLLTADVAEIRDILDRVSFPSRPATLSCFAAGSQRTQQNRFRNII
jgi:hypothetical protein